MIILQYAAFLLPNIKICDYLHHVIQIISMIMKKKKLLL